MPIIYQLKSVILLFFLSIYTPFCFPLIYNSLVLYSPEKKQYIICLADVHIKQSEEETKNIQDDIIKLIKKLGAEKTHVIVEDKASFIKKTIQENYGFIKGARDLNDYITKKNEFMKAFNEYNKECSLSCFSEICSKHTIPVSNIEFRSSYKDDNNKIYNFKIFKTKEEETINKIQKESEKSININNYCLKKDYIDSLFNYNILNEIKKINKDYIIVFAGLDHIKNISYELYTNENYTSWKLPSSHQKNDDCLAYYLRPENSYKNYYNFLTKLIKEQEAVFKFENYIKETISITLLGDTELNILYLKSINKENGKGVIKLPPKKELPWYRNINMLNITNISSHKQY